MMEKRTLWIVWYVLFLICALLGFLPDPQGFWRVVLTLLGVGFFVPGGLLLKWASDRRDLPTVRQVFWISVISLSATTVALILNYLSVLWSELVGTILYGLLVVVSTPMICTGWWIVSLFGWACLLSTAVSLMRKLK